MTTPPSKVRLNKFLAQSGITSRRKADDLIESGKVSLNGEPITTLGTQIDPQKDIVTVEGHPDPITQIQDFLYVAMNKPADYITTLEDELDRQTILDLLPEDLQDKGLKPIGRLDKNTEGLIILTNDTELINKLTHPKYEREKEYEVVISGHLLPEDQELLEEGILLPEEESKTRPCKIDILKTDTQSVPNKSTISITLKEGKKRQIRKMFKQIDQPVIYLQRIRVGTLTLGSPPLTDLPLGQIKLIDKKCLVA